MASTVKSADCVIRGAGIIGLSCALEMAERGARVVLVDPVWPPRGASWAAAGMIAPAFEAAGRSDVHSDLFDLCLDSAGLWPEWSANLTHLSGMDAGYDDTPSVVVATDEVEADRLKAIRDTLSSKSLPWQDIEDSMLPGDAFSGLQLPTDTQVDNRKTLGALGAACEENKLITVAENSPANTAGAELITAGWQSNELLRPSLPIIPISGQMVSVERQETDAATPVRCGSVYIAPKTDRIIIGATMEPETVRDRVDESDIGGLIGKAARLFPDLARRKAIESWAGVRPGTPDHAPYLGKVDELTYVAAGHHRNGILLAPITARIMADLILEGRRHPLLDSFSPLRGVAETHDESGRL